jgi:hypothetical protein
LVCESCGALLEHDTDQHRPGCDVIKEDGTSIELMRRH